MNKIEQQKKWNDLLMIAIANAILLITGLALAIASICLIVSPTQETKTAAGPLAALSTIAFYAFYHRMRK